MINNPMLAAAIGGGGPIVQVVTIGLMFMVFWFLILRPQNKQRNERAAMLKTLKRGDKVITNGGLFATVRDVKEEVVICDISDGVKVEFNKQALTLLTAKD
jgi:preprotein translocase subunit YajC